MQHILYVPWYCYLLQCYTTTYPSSIQKKMYFNYHQKSIEAFLEYDSLKEHENKYCGVNVSFHETKGNKFNPAHEKQLKKKKVRAAGYHFSAVVMNGRLRQDLILRGRLNFKYRVPFLTCLRMTLCYSLRQKYKHPCKIWTSRGGHSQFYLDYLVIFAAKPQRWG